MSEVSCEPSQSSSAHTVIRRDIIRCRLLPGAELTEQDLASKYCFGKTPVREALRRLVQEGLVRVIPRRGYVVTPINVKDVQEIFALRLLLETEASRLAAGRVDGDQLRRLDEICNARYDPSDHESMAEQIRVNTEFHVTVARASGNERLATIVAQLLDESERLIHVGLWLSNRSEEIAHEHRDLVGALLSGDGNAASQLVAAQLHAGQRMVIDSLLDHPQLITVSLAAVQ